MFVLILSIFQALDRHMTKQPFQPHYTCLFFFQILLFLDSRNLIQLHRVMGEDIFAPKIFPFFELGISNQTFTTSDLKIFVENIGLQIDLLFF